MRRLMLLRHAKTENDAPSGRDQDRRLDDRGRKDAAEIGGFIASQPPFPDSVLVSPAVRAHQTWELAWAAMKDRVPPPHVELAPDIYGADPAQLLQSIRDEAHRFALGFHRQRRESRGFASIFDDLEGVGPARRRARRDRRRARARSDLPRHAQHSPSAASSALRTRHSHAHRISASPRATAPGSCAQHTANRSSPLRATRRLGPRLLRPRRHRG